MHNGSVCARWDGMMVPTPRIFISAASADLRSTRAVVAEALRKLECLPKVQEDFPLDHGAVREMLRRTILGCDAVIHIAGGRHGAEPRAREAGGWRRSYTQMEMDMALELRKPLYLFLCEEGYPYDPPRAGDPEEEGEEVQVLQRRHREAIARADALRCRVRSVEEIEKQVLTLRPEVEVLRRRLWVMHWSLVVAALLIAGVLTFVGVKLAGVKRDTEEIAQRSAHMDQGVQEVQVGQSEIRRMLAEMQDEMRKGVGETQQKGRDKEAGVYERALGVLAAKHQMEPDKLREMIPVWIKDLRARAEASPYDLALADYVEGRYASAARHGEESIVQAERRRKEAKIEGIVSREELARGHVVTGDARAAEGRGEVAAVHYRQALALTDREEDPLTWGVTAALLAAQEDGLGRYGEAEQLERGVIAVLKENFGKDHREMPVHQYRLARALIQGNVKLGRLPAQVESEATGLLITAMDAERSRSALKTVEDAWVWYDFAELWSNLDGTPGAVVQVKSLIREAMVGLAELQKAGTVQGRGSAGGDGYDYAYVDDVAVSQVQEWLAELANRVEEWALALECNVAAEASLREMGEEQQPARVRLLRYRGSLLETLGRFEEAEKMYRRGLGMIITRSAPEKLDCLILRTSLARLLLSRVETVPEARQLNLEAGSLIDETTHGAEPGLEVFLPLVLEQRGEIHHALGEEDEAIKCLEQAIVAGGKVKDPAARNLGQLRGTLAEHLTMKGVFSLAAVEHEKAEPSLRETLQRARQQKRLDAQGLCGALNDLAENLEKQSRAAEAEGLWREMLGVYEQRYGAESSWVRYALRSLADNLKETGRYEDARVVLQRALDLEENRHGRTSVRVVPTLIDWAVFHRERGDWQGMIHVCRRIIGILEPVPLRAGVGRAHVHSNLAMALIRQGRVVEAEWSARQAWVGWTHEKESDQGKDRMRVMLALASVVHGQGRSEEAGGLVQRAMGGLSAQAQWQGTWPYELMLDLGWGLLDSGEHAAARMLFQPSYVRTVREGLLKTQNSYGEECRRGLSECLVASGMSGAGAAEELRRVKAEALKEPFAR